MGTSPGTFLRPDIYQAFLETVPFTGILALGLTLVLVVGEIDLSFPSVMAFASFTFTSIYLKTGSVLLGFITCLATGGVIGMLNGMVVTRVGVPSIIATLGMQFLIRGASNLVAAGRARSLQALLGNPLYHAFTGRLWGTVPVQALWFFCLAVFLWLILFRHKLGDQILFVGDNPKAAAMMGINVSRVKTCVFIIMGVLAALVGMLDCFRLRTWWPTMGESILMTVMAAVFIGGTSMFGGEGSIAGTVVGAFLVGSLEAGIVAAGFSGFWTRFVDGAIILIAVTVHTLLRKKRV